MSHRHAFERLVSLGMMVLVLTGWGTRLSAQQSVPPEPLSAAVRERLATSLETLREEVLAAGRDGQREIVDAAIFAKGLEWALRYDREFTPAEVRLLDQALVRGRERLRGIVSGETGWRKRRGTVALGYVSRVDGSVQPFGVVVPQGYDPQKPIRLDVVLHGSTRPVGLSELRWIARFDQGDAGDSATAPDQPFIELHPLGRVENCYRWAGETDVFEAIEEVCRRYAIDRDRIVLRGMSMGASGTWHLGLKHPDRFVALGPYCGYVDTHRFSHLPFSHFVKVGELPEHQERGLRMLDSIDYAANAGVVPAIACMGEKDEAFEAHVLMAEAMRREGLQMVNLISPGTGHVIDPVTQAEQMRLIGAFSQVGLNHTPQKVRFVTWTLKYPRCHWLEAQRLERHYERAELSGRLRGEAIEVDEPKNVTRFKILTDRLPEFPRRIVVGKTELIVSGASRRTSPDVTLVRTEKGWQIDDGLAAPSQVVKRPGVQGPIDDAFTTPFLCVRGTGTPWNEAVQRYADASLERFAEEWRHYFRGELPIKKDTEVTSEEVRTCNLILFGDPGSNRWMAQALPRLPIRWTPETLEFAGQEYRSDRHIPALIYASPFPEAIGAEGATRYVVLNSGHTFREAELAKLNYLLFPRWGDWGILELDPQQDPGSAGPDRLLHAGFFDEQWKFPERSGAASQ
ncbi:MAG: prolyl oligopeptidase family serine peptidase [Planctomycetales bacterium]